MNTIASTTVLPGASIKELASLLKPRVMTLVVFSGYAGLLLAPGHAHPFIQCLTVFAIALGSGSGALINMWYDRDIDIIMNRTRHRPIPSGRIAAEDVLTVGIMLSVAAVMLLGLATNWVAAGWLAFAIVFYAVIYTMGLKRRTPQNIVIGGAAGAFPPLIGWAAVTGNTPLEAWLLFAIIFLWTPPHFWALALNCHDDYRRARIPMMPVTHGARRTKTEMLIYSVLLAAVTLTPPLLGMTGLLYTLAAILLNSIFLWLCIKVYRTEESKRPARKLFGFSILYLFAIFGTLVIDQWV